MELVEHQQQRWIMSIPFHVMGIVMPHLSYVPQVDIQKVFLQLKQLIHQFHFQVDLQYQFQTFLQEYMSSEQHQIQFQEILHVLIK